jgi:hypothetical protein
MTTDQPAPPSIPPRDVPARTASDDGAGTGSAPGPRPGSTVGAAARARAAAAGGVAASAAKRALRGATTVVTGVAPGSSPDGPSGTGPASAPASARGSAAGTSTGPTGTPAGRTPTGTGGSPRASDPKDPTISATDTATRPSRPAPAAAAAGPRDGAPRRVRLSLSRIDPWSVMKLSFLLSFAVGVMIVVAAAVVWLVLDNMAVFTTVNDMLTEIVGEESPIDLLQFLDFSRVISGAAVIAIVDVVLLTALSTLGAFLYNITAALVGGVNVTLTDE